MYFFGPRRDWLIFASELAVHMINILTYWLAQAVISKSNYQVTKKLSVQRLGSQASYQALQISASLGTCIWDAIYQEKAWVCTAVVQLLRTPLHDQQLWRTGAFENLAECANHHIYMPYWLWSINDPLIHTCANHHGEWCAWCQMSDARGARWVMQTHIGYIQKLKEEFKSGKD